MSEPQNTIRPGTQGAGSYEGPVSLNYLLFLPETYGEQPDKRWPLILYLHGRGEAGSEVSLVKRTGLPELLEEKRDFPFITLSPQCPDEAGWWAILQVVDRLLDEITNSYAVDTRRVYLTGNSMGGYGAWALAAYRPERFAAVAPICGGGVPEMACKLREVPVWAFHGEEDDIVPLEAGREMVEALQECGGQVRFTIYPGVEHDSWTPTYQNPELYEWLLEQRRPE